MKLQVVPPRTGMKWVREGSRIFMRQPLALTGLFFLFMTAVMFLGLIPVAGLVAALVLAPVGTLGLLIGASQAKDGKFPWPSCLVQGLRAGREKRRQLLLLGAINAAAVGFIVVIAFLLASHDPIESSRAGPGLVLTPASIVAAALQLPLTLVFALAPALAYWHDVPAVKAVFFSMVAIWRNLGAYCVFALSWAGIFAAALFVSRVLVQVTGPGLALNLLGPIVMVMLAMATASLYPMFRDTFEADSQPPAPDPATDGDSP
jgi:hypothetical protein